MATTSINLTTIFDHLAEKMEANKWHARNVKLQRGGEEKAGAFNETTRSQLASQGYAVISAVLRQDECAKAVDLAWDFVEVICRELR